MLLLFEISLCFDTAVIINSIRDIILKQFAFFVIPLSVLLYENEREFNGMHRRLISDRQLHHTQIRADD